MPFASTPTILSVGSLRVAGGVSPTIIAHDENGHMSRCESPETKLINKTIPMKRFVRERLVGSAAQRWPAANARPEVMNTRKHTVLRIFTVQPEIP